MIHGIDLFAGAGGLSLGAVLAGVDVKYAVEINHAAASTYRLNHPDTRMVEADVAAIQSLPVKRGALNILFGGPPCQGFSTSNQRTRTLANPKNWLYREIFRFARELKPDWVILENVKGLRETAQGKFEVLIRREFDALGYASALWVLHATEFGVPQRRSRLFFVGRRRGPIPVPPHSTCKHAVTVRDAIFDLPLLDVGASLDVLPYRRPPMSAYARASRQGLRKCSGHLVSANNALVQKRYQHIPPGGNWRHIPARLMRNYTNLVDDRSRHTGIYRRLVWNEPSVVIANYRKNMLIHPSQHRGLSLREVARLQSFPDNYRFEGSIGLQQQQVSNAVPPLLATAVFAHIILSS
jgi:DNA (cytosine-5)-methyltransferase 1